MGISRRKFIIGGAWLLGCHLTQPGWWKLPLVAADFRFCQSRQARVLVVIQLTGGNDGLNTVIPYS
ncbi:MAG TPA: hypothetical protein V6D08_13485, partial [Candidatus Obscuribacterales bacterium]